MGSQNVTNFREARKKAIQERISAYDPSFAPTSRKAGDLAAAASAEAIKSLAPKNEFGQALTSKSVKVAAKTISDLVTALRTEAAGVEARSEHVLSTYGVAPSDSQPYAKLVAGLRRKFKEELTATSQKTEAATAAEDALGSTVLDVITRAYPGKRQPTEVTRSELLKAVRKTPDPVFSEVFVKNLLASMLRQTFDAVRGKIPPEQIDALMKAAEPRIRNLAVALTRAEKK